MKDLYALADLVSDSEVRVAFLTDALARANSRP